MNSLKIPEKIVVGFNKRTDTFTGKLAFIIYKDEKGNLKQEKSFNNWIDESMGVVEFNNDPQSGYIVNRDKKRNNQYFSDGRTVIRIFDQRDFEFEITPSNLISIFSTVDSSRGEILEKCVFAWSGKNLVLLPTNSIEYEDYLKTKEAEKPKSFSLKSLQKDNVYKIEQYKGYFVSGLYLGYDYFISEEKLNKNYVDDNTIITTKKQHLFYDIKQKNIFSAVSGQIIGEHSHFLSSEELESIHVKVSNNAYVGSEKIRGFQKNINVDKVLKETKSLNGVEFKVRVGRNFHNNFLVYTGRTLLKSVFLKKINSVLFAEYNPATITLIQEELSRIISNTLTFKEVLLILNKIDFLIFGIEDLKNDNQKIFY